MGWTTGLKVAYIEEEPIRSPMQEAFSRYEKLLSSKERLQYASTTAENLASEVERLQQKHQKLSSSLKIAKGIEPVVKFLIRHTDSVDTLVQANPFPSALVWGSVKVLLNIASHHLNYFEKIVNMIAEMGAALEIYQEYEEIFKTYDKVQGQLAAVYYDILHFFYKAKKLFKRRGFQLFARTLWKSFEADFGKIIENFKRNKDNLHHRIEIAKASDMQAVMKSMQAVAGSIDKLEESQQNGINAAALKASVELKNNVMQWVSASDPEQDLKRESQHRMTSSGDWLISSESFKNWISSISSEHRLLKIIGCPGSGKTVLSTTIVKALQPRCSRNPIYPNSIQTTTGYFYCSKSTGHDAHAIICGLLKQILRHFEDLDLPRCVIDCFEKSQGAGRSSLSAADHPEALLQEVVKQFNSLYIVVDGLDEASVPSDVLKALSDLTEAMPNTRTILLSRDIPEINEEPYTKYSILKLDTLDHTGDVDKYIQERLHSLRCKNPKKYPLEISQKISQKANGMFLWARLMMESLKYATSYEDTLDIVSSMPEELDQFYDRIVMDLFFGDRLRPRMRKLARRVFMLLCAASRPLEWSELRSMLNTNEHGIKQTKVDDPEAILDACRPLIECIGKPRTSPGDAEPMVIRFVHLSVREFFLGARNSEPGDLKIAATTFPFSEAEGHTEVAGICLNYLLGLDKPNQKKVDSKPNLESYASTFWGFHIVRSTYSAKLSERMHEYLSVQSRRMAWIKGQLFRESSGFPLQHLIKIQKQLHAWDGEGTVQQKKERLDWIQDVGRVLIEIDIGTEYTSGTMSGKSRITYFEKLMVIRDLSREYTIRQRLDEGETWMTDALEKRRDTWGEDHISTVWLLNSLGIIYDQQHRVELSAKTHEKALAIQEKVLGPEHLETVWTINELGRVYRHLKRYDDAIDMHLRALKVLREKQPEDVLQLAWTLNTLARAYRKQGSTAKALECHETAIDLQTESLGEEHPHVLWAKADVGRCYRDRGDLEKSAEFHRICLEGRKKVLGLDHADTLWAMNDLGLVLSESGKVDEALELHNIALEGQIKLLGKDHAHTAWSRKQIGDLAWDVVEQSDAE